jgi:hypothetical protein
MSTLVEFAEKIGDALHIPLQEVKDVARRQRLAHLPRSAGRGKAAEASLADAALLLAGVMVMRIERPATRAAALTADIVRLTRLRHGAALYFDVDFILPDDFVGAVGEILAAFADPARRERAREWIGRIGIVRGGGCMAGWIEVRRSEADPWEDFDYAASADDVIAIVETARILRRVEVKASALALIAA